MDKGLEKINELNKKLINIIKNLDIVEKKILEKNVELSILKEEKNLLDDANESLNSDKLKIEYCMHHIKKAKRTKYMCILVRMIVLEIICLLLSLSVLGTDIPNILFPLYNLFVVPLAIIGSDKEDYKSKKRYLKKHNLEEINVELEDIKKQIELNKEKQKPLREKLNIFNDDRDRLNINKENIENKIEQITNLRNDIIEAYISDNKELNYLLNSGYNIYLDDQETNKQLIKE